MTSNNYYRKIRIRCILFASLLSCNYIFAQHHTVSGMLLDGKGKPASMASIKVWNDSAVIKMDYVREDGSFSVPLSNGRYRFQFSSLGVTGVDTTLVVNANVNMGKLVTTQHPYNLVKALMFLLLVKECVNNT